MKILLFIRSGGISLIVLNWILFYLPVILVITVLSYRIGIWQARIKKIMQADEDVGKIAMAVPLLVCKDFFMHILFFLSPSIMIYFRAFGSF